MGKSRIPLATGIERLLRRTHGEGVVRSRSIFALTLLGLLLLVSVSHSVNAQGSFLAPTVSVSPPTIDSGQSSTLTTSNSFSGGTSPYTCLWLQVPPGASSYRHLGSVFTCDTSSLPTASTGTLSTVGTWNFLLRVTDSSSTPVTVNSAPVTVTVNPLLVAPAIGASPGAIDSGQSSTLSTTTSFSGGTSTYTCQWLQQAPGDLSYISLGSSFSCSAGDTPTAPTGTLSTTGTWHFELQVTDSASASVASVPVTVTVSPPLATPTIGASPGAIDTGQSSTLTTTVSFGGGTPTYTCQWLQQAPGAGSPSDLGSSFTSDCTTSSLPSTSTGALSTTGTWSFELQVTDSGNPVEVVTSTAVTVTVNPAPIPPVISVSPTTIDSGQSSTLSTTTSFSGGTSTYTCQWLQEAQGASVFSNLGASFSSGCTTASPPTAPTGALSTVGVWNFELRVTDSSSTPVTVTSNAVLVTVDSALVVPTLVLTPAAIDSGQSATITATVTWSGGTSPYSVELYSGQSSSCASDTTVVAVSGSNPESGLTGTSTTFSLTAPDSTTYYCAAVTDSATSPVTATTSVALFMVNPALTATVSPNAPAIDKGQSVTLTATPSQGASPYHYQWYTGASCGSAISGATSSSHATGVLTSGATYSVRVTDSSTGVPAAGVCTGVIVTVNPDLAAPTISASPGAIEGGQSSTLTTAAHFSGGTSTYGCQWLEEAPGVGSYSSLGSSFSCGASSLPSVSTGILSTLGVWSYELRVTDVTGASATSYPVTVTVSSSIPASFLALSCNHVSAVVGAEITCKATVRGSGSAPTGSVAWSSSSPGKFSSTSCKLSKGACSVKFTPTATGSSVIIAANYGGDSKNSPSQGAYSLTVTKAATHITISCINKSKITKIGASITCTATVSGGYSSLLGTMKWSMVKGTGTGIVTFSKETCKWSSGKGVCYVTVKATHTGSITIMATYSGNSNNLTNSVKHVLTIS